MRALHIAGLVLLVCLLVRVPADAQIAGNGGGGTNGNFNAGAPGAIGGTTSSTGQFTNLAVGASVPTLDGTTGDITATGAVKTGASPPAVTVGTAGAFSSSEGTAPTAAAGIDELWADSTNHAWEQNANGGGNSYFLLGSTPSNGSSLTNLKVSTFQCVTSFTANLVTGDFLGSAGQATSEFPTVFNEPTAGTISHLSCSTSTTVGNGNSDIFTIHVEFGAPGSGPVCTVTGAGSGLCADSTHTATVTAGQRVGLAVTQSGSPTAADGGCCWQIN